MGIVYECVNDLNIVKSTLDRDSDSLQCIKIIVDVCS